MSSSSAQKTYKAGAVIMRQGDKGESAYIIEEGSVEIFIQREDGTEQTVGTRGPGSIIGEMAIIDNAPRTATVRAVQNCTLLEITQEDFSRRLKNADPVLRMTIQVILTRYRDTLTRAEIRRLTDSWPPAESIELGYTEHTDAVETIKIASDFKVALDKREITLHYQPIVNLKTGKVAGFEALMRWQHPQKGFISPAVFIPIIEENGLIVEASRWALHEACKTLKRIESQTGHNRELHMSVNFSSTDFSSDNFVNTIYNIISESDVDPKQIHLEITERLLMQQPDNAKDTLLMCRKAGMGIAIDDFGTGYSSLSYLHYFPIDTLKVDQSFIRTMRKDPGASELVRSIVGLGKNLKMHVIAEGIESKEEGKMLRDMGCDMAQGYFFAKPMPERELIQVLRDWKPADLG
ncbi:MAG TPA: cyclic nucleotide-binding protein [Rhodospirillaceae bacterium]|nr:cyclic nucleotide-binding protein [Rhodospirillaceae bacterium]